MFDNQRYLTSGVQSTLPQSIVLFLWSLIDELSQSDHKLDHLQVFNLWEDKDAMGNSLQAVRHNQEEPEYTAIYNLYLPNEPIHAKVFVIDDTTHSTMLLAEEY